MPAAVPMGDDGAAAGAIVAGFAVTIALFSGSLFISLSTVHSVGAESGRLAANAVPSVLRLSSARTSVRHLEVLADDLVDRGWSGVSAAERRTIADRLTSVEADVAAYLSMPASESERDHWPAIRASLAAVSGAGRELQGLATPRDDAAATRVLESRLKPAADALDQALGTAMVFNARFASELAHDIEAGRKNAVALALSLGSLSLVLSALLLARVLTIVRRQADVVRRNAQLEAARATELELFSARMAHDIRGPLAAVKIGLDLATRPEASPMLPEVLERAQRSLRRAVDIIDGLYEFAGAAQAPEDSAADVASVLAAAVEEIEHRARPAGIDVRFAPQPVAPVRCRPGVLASIASNLLQNAVKFMGESPIRWIRVAASERGQFVRVEVEDSGPGVPASARERIFDPYARATAKSQPGLGLGLATVKRLVTAHGGRVWVESQEGNGALFVVELPKAQRAAPAQAARPA